MAEMRVEEKELDGKESQLNSAVQSLLFVERIIGKAGIGAIDLESDELTGLEYILGRIGEDVNEVRCWLDGMKAACHE